MFYQTIKLKKMKSTLKIMIVTGLIILNTVAVAQNTKKTTQATQTVTIKADPSANMKDFISLLDGKSGGITNALTKYEVADLDRNYMDSYGLINAKVITQEITATTEKYSIEVESGVTTRKYVLLWENGKITKIIDNGFKKPSFD